MASRALPRLRRAVPIAVGCIATSYVFLPSRTLHAEAPPSTRTPEPSISTKYPSRKPIYDDLALLRTHAPSKPNEDDSSTKPAATQQHQSPTQSPTVRLAAQIRRARIFIQAHTRLAEDRTNAFMSSLLNHEASFTSTIASLAPPPESHEHVLPGGLYVLVSAMAGSILARNRGLILRSTTPLAVGVTAAWMILPVTMRNVSDLLWQYEERVPLLAANHMRLRGALEEGWNQGKVRTSAVRHWGEDVVKGGREGLEGWVRRGR